MHLLSLGTSGFLRKPCRTFEMLPPSSFGNDCLPFFLSSHIMHIVGTMCTYDVSMGYLLQYFIDNVLFLFFSCGILLQDIVCVCIHVCMFCATYGESLHFLFLSPSLSVPPPAPLGSSSHDHYVILHIQVICFHVCLCIICVQCPKRPAESTLDLELQIACKSPHGC